MLDMGFEPDILKIVSQCPTTGTPAQGGRSKRQTLFFTATWPKKVENVAGSLTSKAAIQVRIGQGTGGDTLTLNKNVTHEICICDWKDKVHKLKNYLKENLSSQQSAVVFAGSKGRCDLLENELWNDYTWLRAIHSDKDQREREKTLGEFRAKVANCKQAVLVATDVAARGLDVPGISLVCVFDFSSLGQNVEQKVETFVHRIGRTGRAGQTGRAFTLWCATCQGAGAVDTGAPAFVKLLEDANQKVPKKLKDIADGERPVLNSKERRKLEWAAKQAQKSS